MTPEAHRRQRDDGTGRARSRQPEPGVGAMSGESFVDHVALTVAAKNERKSLRRFANLLRRSLAIAWRADRRVFTTNAVLQLTTGVVAAVQVLVTKAVLDAIIRTEEGREGISGAVVPVIALAAVMAFTAVAAAVQQQMQRLLGELVARSTWRDLLAVSTSVPLQAYETPTFYDQLQRVQTNAVSRPFSLSQGLIGLAGGLAGSIGLAAAVLALQPLLLPLLLLSGVPLFWATRRASALEFRFAVEQVTRTRVRDYLARVQTGRDEAKEVRAFGLAGALRERYDAAYDAYVGALRRHVGRRTRLALLGSLASSVLLAGTLLALIGLVARGQVSLAEAGAAIVAVRLLSSQLTQVFASAQQIFESGLFLDDLDHFLGTTPEADERDDAVAPPPGGFDRLVARGVSFTYPGAQEPALRGIDLELHRGQVVALVGENGSGKTTLSKLLAALYEPDEGDITWDAQPLAHCDRTALREQVAVIFQDFVRYQLPANDNIAFGAGDDADEAVVERAARTAGIHDVLASLPAGYDTVLSKAFAGGRELSLGQWQRVALARAYVRDAPFVILDEPSASLDPRAEHELFSRLREVLAGRTVLYVSHRMSTVREADQIYVLHRGEVAEHGSHDELMARGGRYAELFSLQAAGYVGTFDEL